jgi:hypothetical protein
MIFILLHAWVAVIVGLLSYGVLQDKVWAVVLAALIPIVTLFTMILYEVVN